MSINKSTLNEMIIQVFWHNLSEYQQSEIVLNHHQEYNDFLNGNLTGHLSEPVRKLINLDTIFEFGVVDDQAEIVKACIELGADIHKANDWAFKFAHKHELTKIYHLLKEAIQEERHKKP